MSQGPLAFFPAVTYDSGGIAPASVVVADLNGDGKPDLIVANSDAIGVLLGNGDSTFKPAVSYTLGAGTSGLQSAVVADVNGDGKPDVLVAIRSANFGEGGAGVLLGNGDGTFQAPAVYDSGGQSAWSIAVGDVNGDKKPDLMLANADSNSVGVLLGNGDGTFQPPENYDSGGYSPRSVAAADINGDGKSDVLVADLCRSAAQCDGEGVVGVLLSIGNGTFEPMMTYDPGGSNSAFVVGADVNDDGKPDLVVANICGVVTAGVCGGPSTVGVLLGNGDGTFQPAVTYNSGQGFARSAAVADVNGDGKPDVVVGSCCFNTVSVLLGNGDGTFQRSETFDSGGEEPESVAVADVNGDARPDLVAANNGSNTAGVMLNNTAIGKFSSTSFVSSLNPSMYGQKVAWTATVSSSTSVPPTGKVKFTWSGQTIGVVTLNSKGVAILSRSLNADTFPLKAGYSGDTNNLGSTSAVLNQVVQQTTSAAKLTASPNPSTVGQSVTFTAKISSPTVTPTGPVTFTMGMTTLGTAQLSGGKATFTTSTLPAGSNVIKVTYYGNSNIARSSVAVTQVVQP